MAARKRSQEEKNLKTLRELASLPVNKQCFDCHQRGPTYVNMTIGSFICTSCSGMLRGLNPPNRVKSITMTVFTPDEIEFVRSRGNEYCRYVWLGTYDSRSSLMEPEPRDEQKVKDFMIQKYERKRWYVDPEKAVQEMLQKALQESSKMHLAAGNSVPSSQSSTPLSENMPDTKPLSSLLGRNATPLVVQRQHTQVPSNWINPNHFNSNSKPPVSFAQERSSSEVMNIFDSSDMFSGSNSIAPAAHSSVQPTQAQTTNSASYSVANGNFANFESAFNESTTSNGVNNSFGMFGQTSTNSSPTPFPMSNAVETPTPIINSQQQHHQMQHQPKQAQLVAPPSADRYAALADLDSLFHQEPTTTAPSPSSANSTWTASTSATATSVNNNNNSSSMFSNTQPAVNALFAAASANPFTSTTATWSGTNPGSPNQSAQTVNPFQVAAHSQNAPQPALGQQTRMYGQQFGGNPNLGGSPVVVDNFANLSAAPPATMQSMYGGYQNSPNGMQTSTYGIQQNGGMGMSFPWGANTGNPVQANTAPLGWGLVTPGQVGAYQNSKHNGTVVSSPQQVHVSANPFMSNQVSNALRTNPSNPFL